MSKQVLAYLNTWTQSKIEQMERELDASNSNATGNLRASMDWRVRSYPGRITATLEMPDYYTFIDLGVKGTESDPGTFGNYQYKHNFASRAMIDAISQWISFKAIRVRTSNQQSTQNVLSQRKSMAFAIATSVKKKGIKGTQFYSKAINDKEFDKLASDLLDMFGDTLMAQVQGQTT
jgi:hypothetical protein